MRRSRHYHVNMNGQRQSWASVTFTRHEANELRARLGRSKLGRPRDTFDVETCSGEDCREYGEMVAYRASVPPVTAP